MKEVTDFIWGVGGEGSKITEDSDCSHEIKRCLFLGRKALTNLNRVLKNRDATFPTKVCIGYSFSIVMYGCKSWTIKKAERCGIDAFELWCLRRLLRVPWTLFFFFFNSPDIFLTLLFLVQFVDRLSHGAWDVLVSF